MAEQNDRIRKSISIIGLNTSASDLNAQDGTCERLHNLRYSAGSWQPVPYFRLKWAIAGYSGFKIVYKHPAASDERYIAIDQNQALHEIRVDRGKTASTQLLAERMDNFRSCNHFGNVLIVRIGDGEQKYFVLNDGQYREFAIPQPAILRSNTSYPGINCTYIRDMSYQCHPIYADNTAEYDIMSIHYRIMNITTGEALVPVNDGRDDAWHGELLLFAAYRMSDGTTVATSPLYLFDSDLDSDGSTVHRANNNLDSSDTSVFLEISRGVDPNKNPQNPLFFSTSRLLRCKPRIIINIDKEKIDDTLISGVAIYSTRVNPIYDYESIARGSINDRYEIGAPILFTDLYANNKLPEQPFYLIKEIKISEFRDDGDFAFELGYSLLKDIVSKPVYEPMQSLHKVVGNVFYDYNDRMHIGDVTTTLFKGYDLAEMEYDDRVDTYIATTLKKGGKKYNTKKRYNDKNFILYAGKIVSYPDYRATELRVIRVAKTTPQSLPVEVGQPIKLLPAASLNYAYYMPPYQEVRKHPNITATVGTDQTTAILTLPDDQKIIERNRVQVSAPNNVFAFPFAQSYTFGRIDETVVISLASTADQLSEGRFGAYPLYVFTSDGIWALENGQGEILYSNTVPINHDVVANPSNASARNAVFYITSRGLHAIQGRDSKMVSAPLEDRLDKLRDYFQSAIIKRLFNSDELLVYNSMYDYAYVYSLAAGYWSTRGMQGTVLESDEIISGKTIYNIQEDQAAKCLSSACVVTRPIKFESVEFKRLETLIVRLSSDTNIYTDLVIEGSQDCEHWFPLRHETLLGTRQDITIRRTSISAKFFRITLTMNVTMGVRLDRLDAEFYHRFIHRLR